MKRWILSRVAWCVLLAGYGGATLIASLLKGRRSRRAGTGRILVTGTFYNRGWFLSHMEPLARCGVREVVVVTDVQQPAPAGVRVLSPSAGLVRVVGRAGAKLWLMWRAGRQYAPDLYMGYHLFPGALSALIVARLLGRPAIYQMTGGPVEIAGGGWQSENVLTSKLGRASSLLERIACRAVRQFDLVVVRGGQARRYLGDRGVDRTAIITGSVWTEKGDVQARNIDLIFVGRLSEIKQPGQFVEIVGQIASLHPQLRAVMVGGGPDLDRLRRQASRLGVSGNIEFLGQREDVRDLLGRSRVFVLTSRSEGMSIAMIEAMSCGVPPVVADVGELGDVVKNGVNGWLVRGGDVSAYVHCASELLRDERRWQAFSQAARAAALDLSSVENVSKRWKASFADLGTLAEASLNA